jgi:two-component system response regulator VicR
MKVLVVDDEKIQCMFFKSELEDEGYEVVTANNAEEAMELFARENPDLVTLDIAMPSIGEKTGLKLLRQMQDTKPSVRIIILSAFDFTEDTQTWYADAYITKSSDSAELKNTIKSILKEGCRRF